MALVWIEKNPSLFSPIFGSFSTLDQVVGPTVKPVFALLEDVGGSMTSLASLTLRVDSTVER